MSFSIPFDKTKKEYDFNVFADYKAPISIASSQFIEGKAVFVPDKCENVEFYFSKCDFEELVLDFTNCNKNNIKIKFSKCAFKKLEVINPPENFETNMFAYSAVIRMSVKAPKISSYYYSQNLLDARYLKIISPEVSKFIANDEIKNLFFLDTKSIEESKFSARTLSFPETLEKMQNTSFNIKTMNYFCNDLSDFANNENSCTFYGTVENLYIKSSVKAIRAFTFTNVDVQNIYLEDGIQILESGIFDGKPEFKTPIPETVKYMRRTVSANLYAPEDINEIIGYPSCVKNVNGFYIQDGVLIDISRDNVNTDVLLLPDEVTSIADSALSIPKAKYILGKNIKELEMFALWGIEYADFVIFPKLKKVHSRSWGYAHTTLVTEDKEAFKSQFEIEDDCGLYDIKDAYDDTFNKEELINKCLECNISTSAINNIFKTAEESPYIYMLLEDVFLFNEEMAEDFIDKLNILVKTNNIEKLEEENDKADR